MTDIHNYIKRLLDSNPLREPLFRSVVQALQLPLGSEGLDAGCGIGLQALLLADAIGPGGHVTGMDIVPEFLDAAEDFTREAGLSERITYRVGDMNCLPFPEDTFDWVWSADCIGYPLGEWAPLLKELMRVVRPGGKIVILAWSSQQLLPGYPFLEARLNANYSSYIPFMKGKSSELNFLRAPRWFLEAGLEEVSAQTFIRDIQAPLSSSERAALTSLFEMLWEEPLPDVSAEDWAEYHRLCKPGSKDIILDLPGYYAFFTYTVFRGKVPYR
ncbi:MAG: class I SAM-dependent methyltransferase [Omnitrophica WOR_2 bacterium]